MLYDCGHEISDEAKYVCAHLVEASDKDYFRIFTIFTGHGREYRVACETCANSNSQEAIPWKSVCAACLQRVEAENGQYGVRGMPEVREKPSALAFSHRIFSGEFAADPLRLIQPITKASESGWIALTASGVLVKITFGENGATYRTIATLTADDLSLTEAVSLVCSVDGKLVCLTETLGVKGVVLETREGRRTMRLLRSSYHSDKSPFPAAFIESEGRTLLVHGVDWNRLDISDPLSGEARTERPQPQYQESEPLPLQYLDYFHGRLLPSADSNFIADDGWVWQPDGIVRTWNVRTWLSANRWESEDGPSVRNLLRRGYFWGGPMCWINATTLAVWGYGDDEDYLIPAVRIFDVVLGSELNWFPGPEVAPSIKATKTKYRWETWAKPLIDFGGRFFFDRYLFAVSGKFGVGVWDVADGARLHQDASFAPVAYHPGKKEFLTLLPEGSVQLSHLVEPEESAGK